MRNLARKINKSMAIMTITQRQTDDEYCVCVHALALQNHVLSLQLLVMSVAFLFLSSHQLDITTTNTSTHTHQTVH